VVSLTRSLLLQNIAPMPVKNHLTVTFDAVEQSDIDIQVYDAMGRLVLREKGIANQGNNQVRLDVNKLVPANYILQISTANQAVTEKFVKE